MLFSEQSKKTSLRTQVIPYVPAELRENKEWIIVFYVKHPITGQLVRQRLRCNKFSSKTKNRDYARSIVRNINVKLADGWNPLIEREGQKAYTRLAEAMEIFMRNKRKEFRPDSIRSYQSYIHIIEEYLQEKKQTNLLSFQFDRSKALDFIQWAYFTRDITERTYNNYVRFFKTLFNWFVEQQYTAVNPFENLKRKKEQPKTRQLITVEFKNKIRDYLEKENYQFLCVCLIAYYSLLRPKEITYIKMGDINLEKQIIKVSGKNAKNGKDRYPTIPDALLPFLKKLNYDYPLDYYLFSNNLIPGKTKLDPRMISRYWDRLRNNLDVPKEMQFYSLRDSGIVQMIEDGIPLNIIRDQADHSSLEITNIYTKHISPEAHNKLRSLCSDF